MDDESGKRSDRESEDRSMMKGQMENKDIGSVETWVDAPQIDQKVAFF